MKRLTLVPLILCLMAGSAVAGQFGLRGGLSLSPDQFHFGAHVDLGPQIDMVRIVPNIEIGLGDNATLIALNSDFIYDFPETPWSAGAELGINIYSFDVPNIPGIEIDDTSTDIGLSILGDYHLTLNSGRILLLEAKLGLSDSPDFKFTVGWDF